MSRTCRRIALVLSFFLPVLGYADTDYAVEASLTYDDNVFRLRETKKDNVDGTGRYADMESAGDLIVRAGARLDLETKATGRRTRLRLEPEARLFLQNTRSSFFAFDASLTQGLWKGGDAFVEASLTPYRFKKNYYSFGTYQPGEVSEAAAWGGLRFEVGKNASFRFAGGVLRETWLSKDFENRNEAAAAFDGAIGLDLGKKLDAGARYRFVSASTRAGQEQLSDGTLANVDRSFVSHEVAPELRIKIAKDVKLLGGASYRRKQFLSAGAGDPHVGRVDQKIGLDAGIRFSGDRLQVEAGYSLRVNGTNRPNDLGGQTTEELDYASNAVSVGLTWAF